MQAGVRDFRARAEETEVAVIDATHYGLEKPPLLAMADWFRRMGLRADFVPDGPK